MIRDSDDSPTARRFARAVLGCWIVAWSFAAIAVVQAVSGDAIRCASLFEAVGMGGLLSLIATATLLVAICRTGQSKDRGGAARITSTPADDLSSTSRSFEAPRADARGVIWSGMTLLPGGVIAWVASPGGFWSTLAGYGVVAVPCAWSILRFASRDAVVADNIVADAPVDEVVAAEDDVETEDDAETEYESECDDSLVQRFTRGKDASGELLEGLCRIDFALGQRQASLHVPFVPPFASVPRITATPADGDDGLRLTVAANYRYGARIDVRRADATEARATWVAIEARAEERRAKAA